VLKYRTDCIIFPFFASIRNGINEIRETRMCRTALSSPNFEAEFNEDHKIYRYLISAGSPARVINNLIRNLFPGWSLASVKGQVSNRVMRRRFKVSQVRPPVASYFSSSHESYLVFALRELESRQFALNRWLVLLARYHRLKLARACSLRSDGKLFSPSLVRAALV